ncbi:Uncharacterized protein Fot_04748 [Forsythia ovata]|uniref:Uncharacterized protein n=1 Tax=Forsythia ovata TaxID=205694 RepID=A0ABD1XDF4_9LAMI
MMISWLKNKTLYPNSDGRIVRRSLIYPPFTHILKMDNLVNQKSSDYAFKLFSQLSVSNSFNAFVLAEETMSATSIDDARFRETKVLESLRNPSVLGPVLKQPKIFKKEIQANDACQALTTWEKWVDSDVILRKTKVVFKGYLHPITSNISDKCAF